MLDMSNVKSTLEAANGRDGDRWGMNGLTDCLHLLCQAVPGMPHLKRNSLMAIQLTRKLTHFCAEFAFSFAAKF